MKMKLFVVLTILLFVAAALAQFGITSFNSSGKLTWTNSVSNATYRVQWASSPTGSWHSFDALTNLNSILATNNRVTIQVPAADTPTFYRVVWSDAPPYAGLIRSEWKPRGDRAALAIGRA